VSFSRALHSRAAQTSDLSDGESIPRLNLRRGRAGQIKQFMVWRWWLERAPKGSRILFLSKQIPPVAKLNTCKQAGWQWLLDC